MLHLKTWPSGYNFVFHLKSVQLWKAWSGSSTSCVLLSFKAFFSKTFNLFYTINKSTLFAETVGFITGDSASAIYLRVMPSKLCMFVRFYILLCFVAVKEGSVLKVRRLKKGQSLTFTGSQSYAIFENWTPSPHGALQLYFKTVKKDAFLMYIDDMGQREFIDLFLVNGSVRLRLTVGRCVMATTFVYGQFHDARWHRVFVSRKQDQTILIVDENRRSKAINCSGHSTFKVKSNIIMGSFNFSPNISSQDFALGQHILWETEKNR